MGIWLDKIQREKAGSAERCGLMRTVLTLCCSLLMMHGAYADLELLDSFSGNYSLSVDGGGAVQESYTIEVLRPNNRATVLKAYVMAAAVFGNTVDNGDVLINGTPVTWASTLQNGDFHNGVADVTSLVKPIVDGTSVVSPGGERISFTFTEVETSSDLIDGCALAVVFDDPQAPVQTVFLLFGGLSPTGDRFSITTGEVIPTDGRADMGLGISFGSQPGDQVSLIDVNGQRLTSTAGGQDDYQGSSSSNGALITVGGLNDSNDNPVNPSTWTPGDGGTPPYSPDPRDDDELYSLIPFLVTPSADTIGPAATNIQITTLNPSNDDNIFFAYFMMSGSAILGEGMVLSPAEATKAVGSSHSVTATLVDAGGDPLVGRSIRLKVISGPNANAESSVLTTDGNGQASWSYPDLAQLVGTDRIEGSFINSDEIEQYSNIVSVTWQDSVEEMVQSIDLYTGWNLVFLQVDPDETDPSQLFGSDTYVYSFRKEGAGYTPTYAYDLETGSGSLSGGRVYWVFEPERYFEYSPGVQYYSRTVEITGNRNTNSSVLLTRAWNLLGVQQQQLLPRSSTILSVWYWDAELEDYQRPAIDTSTGRYILLPGVGYFVFVSEPVQLLIDSTN